MTSPTGHGKVHLADAMIAKILATTRARVVVITGKPRQFDLFSPAIRPQFSRPQRCNCHDVGVFGHVCAEYGGPVGPYENAWRHIAGLHDNAPRGEYFPSPSNHLGMR